jgi:excisionase family DNA binding protein
MTGWGDDALTVAQAAAILGVSQRNVEQLARNGSLTTLRTAGRALLLDASSVRARAAHGSYRGRPWTERNVWQALALLGHTAPPDSPTVERLAKLRSQLRVERLRGLEQWPAKTAARAEVSRWRVAPSYLPALRDRVALTGMAAVAVDRDAARRFGLAATVAPADVVDGYTTDAAALAAEHYLTPDPRGNVTLRQTRYAPDGPLADDATIALDLAASLDVRLRRAGLDRLAGMAGQL